MITMHIPGMRCGGCAARIGQALRAADPQCRFEPDIAARTVQVDSRLDRTVLERALAGAGYPPAELALGSSDSD